MYGFDVFNLLLFISFLHPHKLSVFVDKREIVAFHYSINNQSINPWTLPIFASCIQNRKLYS